VNCSVSSAVINEKNWSVNIRVADQNYDAVYQLVVSDSADNKTIITDTIQGFTLSLKFAESDHDYTNLGTFTYGEQKCDSIILRNYGLKPLFVDRFSFAHNTAFSIPQYEFPIVIPPNDTRKVEYCYYASRTDGLADFDSIIVTGNCLDRRMKFMAVSVGSDLLAEDQCGNSLTLTSGQGKSTFFLSEVFPNPVVGDFYVQFGLALKATVKLEIYDLNGAVVKTLINEALAAGLYRRDFSSLDLPNGVYLLKLIAGTNQTSVSLVINK
jgi:hypothetical protein